ncbi:hypothetical protein J6590_024346 [Homalodisca vitripennis]|nr:hypothetical protein J6590_024346 [Homalodisca vitripennis]
MLGTIHFDPRCDKDGEVGVSVATGNPSSVRLFWDLENQASRTTDKILFPRVYLITMACLLSYGVDADKNMARSDQVHCQDQEEIYGSASHSLKKKSSWKLKSAKKSRTGWEKRAKKAEVRQSTLR